MADMEYLKELDLHEIAEMDGGRIGTAVRQALIRVAADMNDRPGDDRARKVSLEIAAVPVADEHGFVDAVKLQMQVKDSIPTRKSRVYDIGLRRSKQGGMMVYSPSAVDNHRQPGLPVDDDE